jgi:Zn-dependent protease with chaperone function
MNRRPPWIKERSRMPLPAIVIVAIMWAGAVMVMGLLLTVARSRNAPGLSFFSVLMPIGLGMVLFVVYWKMMLQKPRLAVTFDQTRLKLFNDSLQAVSLGLGVGAPNLVVLALPVPDLLVTDFGGRKTLALSPQLLELDLTNQEVEAVMATGLAKMIDSRIVPSWPDIYEELKVDGDITGQIQSFTWDQNIVTYCTSVLRSDTLAAKITGQPGALQSAITKIHEVVKNSTRIRGRAPVEPFGRLPIAFFNSKKITKLSDELTRLRLENLERIEAGERPDFSELRDGRPVVGPKGWE